VAFTPAPLRYQAQREPAAAAAAVQQQTIACSIAASHATG